MNREEFVTKVRNLVNQAFFHGIDNKYYKGLMHEAEKLRYPITLAEFLGWEEGVEYKCLSGRYKVVDGELLYYCSVKQDYKPVKVYLNRYAKVYLNRSNILTMREAEKVEQENKYRIPLPFLITTDGMQQYLTERDGNWFANSLTDNLKQEWTEDELHRIPTAYLIYAKATGEDEHNAGHNIEVWRWIDE